MEKQNMFLSEENTMPYGISLGIHQANEFNCSAASEQLQNCYFNPDWENSMDQRDPFSSSALSSMVSSPAANNTSGGNDNFLLSLTGKLVATIIRCALDELIGRLGNICPSGEVSHSYADISMVDQQNLINASLSFPRNQSIKVSGSHMAAQVNSAPENSELGDSRENSSVSEQIPGGETAPNGANSRKRKTAPKEKGKDTTNVATENNESDRKRNKPDEDENQKQNSKENPMAPEPPKDYIHVRARRGQATDAHSLAERVRREKISERMKLLQDLVPGCNRVTGKAVMLDEIINYVQSLQRQVEMILQSRGSMHHNMFPSEASYGQNLHIAMSPITPSLGMRLPPMGNFLENPSQIYDDE